MQARAFCHRHGPCVTILVTTATLHPAPAVGPGLCDMLGKQTVLAPVTSPADVFPLPLALRVEALSLDSPPQNGGGAGRDVNPGVRAVSSV